MLAAGKMPAPTEFQHLYPVQSPVQRVRILECASMVTLGELYEVVVGLRDVGLKRFLAKKIPVGAWLPCPYKNC
jgi:hypothetical protein